MLLKWITTKAAIEIRIPPPPPKLTPPLKFLFVIDIRVREIDYRNVTGNDKQ